MVHELSRRAFLSGLSAAVLSCISDRAPSRSADRDARDLLAELEGRIGGRLGVCVIDPSGRVLLARRDAERFALCSTFKWALAAKVFAEVDRGNLALNQELAFTEKDLLEYAPVTRAQVTRAQVGRGQMTIEELAMAAVSVSDNTAANLLLDRIGGPARLTQFLREHGDGVTRLDRNEPTLNTNEPGDPRDTTTPQAMAGLMRTLLLGEVLSTQSRERLLSYMLTSPTGKDRLRAGFPKSYRVADKTGTGGNGAVNDVAVVWPPNHAPLVVACYMSESHSALPTLVSGHAEVGRLVVRSVDGQKR
jgi:beta-lactamase class A